MAGTVIILIIIQYAIDSNCIEITYAHLLTYLLTYLLT